MRLIRFALASICIASAGTSQAQTREEFERCRAMGDDQRRLACYDAIAVSPASPRSKYEPVALDELKAYALSFRGRFVETSGWIRPERSYLFLGLDVTDEDPMPVEFEALPRRQRDDILEACGSGC